MTKDTSRRPLLLPICVASGIFCLLFLVSVFKHISYPLFWADESMTVVGGTRVLQFGYPKVHDGKNVFYDLAHPNARLGVDEKTDAYIGGANWSMYYVAAAGVKLAQMSGGDFYEKTGIIRTVFAVIGVTGIALFALSGVQFFHTTFSRMGILALFSFLELCSIPLALHLREARYYPIALFLTALTLLTYTRYRILEKSRYPEYVVLLTGCLLLIFMTFSPVYFIFLGSLSFFELALVGRRGTAAFSREKLARKLLIREYLRGIAPLLLSFIAVFPLLFFFRTFHISEEISNFNALAFNISRPEMYYENFRIIWRYFSSSELLWLAIFLRSCVVYCRIRMTAEEKRPAMDRSKLAFSDLLSVFFIVYIFAICRIPNFPYTRYAIPIQPVLTLIIVLDLALVCEFLRARETAAVRYVALLLLLVSGFIVQNISRNMEFIRGHIYELTHLYKGPLDYVIPYIANTIENTQDLVIATNYEETSFMYYLNAKVTVGFVGNNLEDDSKIPADIVVFRKPYRTFIPVFQTITKMKNYTRIVFPVADYPVNNIPELNRAPGNQHQFRTLESRDGRENVELYVGM